MRGIADQERAAAAEGLGDALMHAIERGMGDLIAIVPGTTCVIRFCANSGDSASSSLSSAATRNITRHSLGICSRKCQRTGSAR